MQLLPTFDLVLFGGTGALAMRKLLPALYRRTKAGQVAPQSRIIGAARSDISREEYLKQILESCESRLGKEVGSDTWEKFAATLDYVKVDARSDSDFENLA